MSNLRKTLRRVVLAGACLAGAAIGGAAGYLIARSDRSGYCIYRDRYGHRYEARCR